MILTEEIIRNLPVITDEELREISCSTEVLIEEAINELNRKADIIYAEFEKRCE